MILASIPSPSQGVWNIGPFPLRAYALAIICGIVVAWWILSRRYRAKGGPEERIIDLVFVMVISGIVGGRLYHVLTDHRLYFGEGRNPWDAFAVWNGGLGIWGAITLGGIGAWLGCRHYGLRLAPIADAIAPALLVAQAIGRLGNYFNQELYGRPTDLPWALEIDAAHIVGGYPPGTTFHPTFLYELLWCLAGAAILLAIEKRLDLRGGQVFACYVMWYTSGRVWIENLRIDSSNHILGLRLNVWTSIIVFIGGFVAFLILRRKAKRGDDVDAIWLPGCGEENVHETSSDIGDDKTADAADDDSDKATDDTSADAGDGTDGASQDDVGDSTPGNADEAPEEAASES